MKIEQFYDDALAQSSYAILSEKEVAVIDPARNPKPYYDWADKHNARIVAVFETHPHADFVSGHKQIAEETGARIYVSPLLGAEYEHESFQEDDKVNIGNVTLRAMGTPGHSPDSISIILSDEHGKDKAVFTGDTLFVGDVGRPDLRENAGNIQAQREELAKQMYHSVQEKLANLDDDVQVFPAHGPGSLCGKNISDDLYSTIGREKQTNYAFQDLEEAEFVKQLIEGQPWIPKYFPHEVAVNKKGAAAYEESIRSVSRYVNGEMPEQDFLVVDTRTRKQYEAGHLPGAVNIPDGNKFETWLGTLVAPEEPYYLIAEDEENLEKTIRKSAKIGYEQNIHGAFINPAEKATEKGYSISARALRTDASRYTIVDVRTQDEHKAGNIFEKSLNIPLSELRERAHEIPEEKPVVVHCAGGYRSAAGASILQNALNKVQVFDLGEQIKEFQKAAT